MIKHIEIENVKDVHHVHVWSMDGFNKATVQRCRRHRPPPPHNLVDKLPQAYAGQAHTAEPRRVQHTDARVRTLSARNIVGCDLSITMQP